MDSNNSELIKEIQHATKIQTMNGVPRSISNQIVPVIEVNPKVVKNAIIRNVTTSSGATTIYTTPTNQDFYLCSATLSIAKDVTCDTGAVNLRCVIDGATRQFLDIAGITLTAAQSNTSVSFPHPIKIDRNTVIQMNHTKTAGTFFGAASITGFIDDCSNG